MPTTQTPAEDCSPENPTAQEAIATLRENQLGPMNERLCEIWREAQSEIYGEGIARIVEHGHTYTQDFIDWFQMWTPPAHLAPLSQFDLVSAIGIFERWLLTPLGEQSAAPLDKAA